MEALVTIEAIGLRSIAGRWRKNFGGDQVVVADLFFFSFFLVLSFPSSQLPYYFAN
ncbi:hypothetical protein BDZ91DRAFT_733639, partial [Kalaharituber pfeilii]